MCRKREVCAEFGAENSYFRAEKMFLLSGISRIAAAYNSRKNSGWRHTCSILKSKEDNVLANNWNNDKSFNSCCTYFWDRFIKTIHSTKRQNAHLNKVNSDVAASMDVTNLSWQSNFWVERASRNLHLPIGVRKGSNDSRALPVTSNWYARKHKLEQYPPSNFE